MSARVALARRVTALSVVVCLIPSLSGLPATAWDSVPLVYDELGGPYGDQTEGSAGETDVVPNDMVNDDMFIESYVEEGPVPFLQTFGVCGLSLELAADPGVFEPDTYLCIDECTGDLMSREVEANLGLVPDEWLLVCHTQFCLSGPAPNGYVLANVYDTLCGALRDQYPDAVIDQQLLYVWEIQNADPNGLRYGVDCLCSGEGGSILSFPLTQMGYYEVLTTIQLPRHEFVQEYAEDAPVESLMEPPVDTGMLDPAALSAGETMGGTEVDSETASYEGVENMQEESPSAPADVVEEAIDEVPDPLAGMIYISPCGYAPSGYLMLNINVAPDEGCCWAFDGDRMLATTDGSYRILIPAEYVSEGLLTPDGRALVTVVPDAVPVTGRKGYVNQDGVVNIADANTILQLVKEGFAYYDVEQLSPQQRMQADVDGDLMYSIADVNEIVNTINNGIV